jgi:hypothetical protein
MGSAASSSSLHLLKLLTLWKRWRPIKLETRNVVTSLVLTRIENVEFQTLELKWSARLSNKIVSLFPSPKFLDLILASTVPLGFKPC